MSIIWTQHRCEQRATYGEGKGDYKKFFFCVGGGAQSPNQMILSTRPNIACSNVWRVKATRGIKGKYLTWLKLVEIVIQHVKLANSRGKHFIIKNCDSCVNVWAAWWNCRGHLGFHLVQALWMKVSHAALVSSSLCPECCWRKNWKKKKPTAEEHFVANKMYLLVITTLRVWQRSKNSRQSGKVRRFPLI